MNCLDELNEWSQTNGSKKVAIIGSGFVATGVAHVLRRTPGVDIGLIVNRNLDRAKRLLIETGWSESDIVVSDDPQELHRAISNGTPAVTSDFTLLEHLPISLAIEATGAIDYGVRAISAFLNFGLDVISFNAEADSLFASEFHRLARKNGVVYTIADGDQPGALLRLKIEAESMGFEVRALINCKRHLNPYQTPKSGEEFSSRDSTSSIMTTAFGDGTKMQIEQCVVANACNLAAPSQGMLGIETTLENAAKDIGGQLKEGRFVDYTLGGDFGAGVGVLCQHPDFEAHKNALRLYKMGDGPDYFLFRAFHLVHLELAMTLADVLIRKRPLAQVSGQLPTEVIAIAKKDLSANETLDCIGGFTAYGHIANADDAEGYLPMCLIEYASLRKELSQDTAIPLDHITLDTDVYAVKLWLDLQKEHGRNTEFLSQL